MSAGERYFTAREKLCAVALVYAKIVTIQQACDAMDISRTAWYEWEKQLKSSIQPMWGGLSRHHKEN